MLGRNVDATHRQPAQDRLGVARHQLRHGVLAEHAARRAAPRADDARISQGHRRRRARRKVVQALAERLPAGDRHQGRRHRRGGQGAARQGDERDQRDGRRDAADRRARARRRGRRRRSAAANIWPCSTRRSAPRACASSRAELLEFGLLGLATALLAVAIAHDHRLGAVQMGLRGRLRVSRRLPPPRRSLLALALVLGVGAIATWRVLSAKAAPYLRAE